MPLKPEQYQTLIDRARENELGIFVETNNPPRLAVDLDVYLKQIGQNQTDLMVCSVEGAVMIIHKSVELDYDLSK